MMPRRASSVDRTRVLPILGEGRPTREALRASTALCNDNEPGILGAWPLRRCSKQAFMYRRCDVSQWHYKLL
jgi:hypothetical protein